MCRSSIYLQLSKSPHRHQEIYLFDYCPASWQVVLIDGHCVRTAAGLLVSLAANSLKDSSVETLFALFHFNSFSLPPAHYPPPPLLYPPPSLLPVYYSVLKFLLVTSVFSCLFFGCKYDLGQFNVSSGNVLKYFCERMKGVTRSQRFLAAKPQTWQVVCWVN